MCCIKIPTPDRLASQEAINTTESWYLGLFPGGWQPIVSIGLGNVYFLRALCCSGCGKSTLMMSLYRLVEASNGRIVIDGIDISKIGLFDLRSNLSLVPQDPVIFSGTVRSNLDPFGNAGGDAQIWNALKQSGMDEFVRAMEVRCQIEHISHSVIGTNCIVPHLWLLSILGGCVLAVAVVLCL